MWTYLSLDFYCDDGSALEYIFLEIRLALPDVLTRLVTTAPSVGESRDEITLFQVTLLITLTERGKCNVICLIENKNANNSITVLFCF